jgi:hypothetical protein
MASAATGGLDQHRVAEPRGLAESLLRVADRAGARHDRQAGPARDGPRGQLVAHGHDGGRRRPDEDQSRRGDRAGEPGVLAQQAVSRIHRVRSGVARGGEDGVLVKVGGGDRSRAETAGLVGQPDVQRQGVGVAVHGDGAQPESAVRADEPDRDLAAVRHQHRPDHQPSTRSATEQPTDRMVVYGP